MLRSPTVFEDLVKMICTTNCSWALTQKMVTGLVQNLGREAKDGRRTFPTPEAMALMPEKFYVNEVRAGYRAPYLKELADRVASATLNVFGSTFTGNSAGAVFGGGGAIASHGVATIGNSVISANNAIASVTAKPIQIEAPMGPLAAGFRPIAVM